MMLCGTLWATDSVRGAGAAAGKALYAAKNAGRNCVCVAGVGEAWRFERAP
jgi:hypothetical protein